MRFFWVSLFAVAASALGFRDASNALDSGPIGPEQRSTPAPSTAFSLTRVTELGALAHGPNDLFGEVVGARRLANGDIVVADIKSLQIKLFDSTGSYIGLVGHRGEGPGDYQSISLLPAGGDTVLISDGLLSRITGMSIKRVVTSLYSVPRPTSRLDPSSGKKWGPWCEMIGRFSDGKTLSLLGMPDLSHPRAPRTDSLALEVVDATRAIRISVCYNAERFSFEQNSYSVSDDAPFTAKGLIAASSLHWYYNNGSDFDLRQFNEHGQLENTIHLPGKADAVTAADIARYSTSFIGHAGGPNAAALRSLYTAAVKSMVFPRMMPTFDELTTDALGFLWVRSFRNDEAPHAWQVVCRSAPSWAQRCCRTLATLRTLARHSSSPSALARMTRIWSKCTGLRIFSDRLETVLACHPACPERSEGSEGAKRRSRRPPGATRRDLVTVSDPSLRSG